MKWIKSSQDDGLYLLLDFVGATTLLEFIYPGLSPDASAPQANPILPDLQRVVSWSIQLADVLLYLHQQMPFPVLHRDLKPATIRLTAFEENIALLDFGLLNAFRVASASSRKTPGSVHDYFADPKLLRERWSDPRVDIYAFGRILDFMLTGILPPKSGAQPTFPEMDSHLDEHSRKVLSRVISRCCQSRPDDRYPDIRALVTDLEMLQEMASSAEVEQVACPCGHLNRASARFCERCGQLVHPVGSLSGPPTGTPPAITYDEERHAQLLTHHDQGHLAPLSRYLMREALDKVQSDPGFDELISLESLPLVEKLPYQRDAALRALKRMRGRVLLADEVGLGKSIEAGIILKELMLRQLVSTTVVFCPGQLLSQWQTELYDKFDEVFLVLGRDIDTSLAWYCPRLIAPYEIVRQRFHVEEMLRHHYDLVILDEAHSLNYEENWRILRAMKNLQKKYFLLLSATPMHNSLDELYNIITLLRPGHFDDLPSFRAQFVNEGEPTRPRNTQVLRNYLQEVMIRNIRRQVALDYPFPTRNASTVALKLDKSAQSFYSEFRTFYRDSLSHIHNARFLLRMAELVERLCSSADAFREPVNRLSRDRNAQRQIGEDFIHHLKDFAARYPASLIEPKLRATEETLHRLMVQGQRVLVFSQFNETAQYVHRRLGQTDLRGQCWLYDESSPWEKKAASLRQFHDSRSGVLVCPGEASEGLNLQFANMMINFDLPWDPMKLEQRIGRIQRIGGKSEVHIVNLVLEGTIEEDILHICEQKIEMFGDVIGQVEPILGELRDEDDFRTMICNMFLDRWHETEDGKRVSPRDHLEDELEEARKRAKAEEESEILNTILIDFSATDEDED